MREGHDRPPFLILKRETRTEKKIKITPDHKYTCTLWRAGGDRGTTEVSITNDKPSMPSLCLSKKRSKERKDVLTNEANDIDLPAILI